MARGGPQKAEFPTDVIMDEKDRAITDYLKHAGT